MTTTFVREALRAVADTIDPPALDRVAVQHRVQHERSRHGKRRATAAAAAAVVMGISASALHLASGDGQMLPPAGPLDAAAGSGLRGPVYLVADGRLLAVDSNGNEHDLGRAEEIVGSTAESVWYVDSASALVDRTLSTQGDRVDSWRWSKAATVVAAASSAQVSTDGRWLGWVDLRDVLHVEDLTNGTEHQPVRLEGSGYLVDLAEGTGLPLVSDRRGLMLLTEEGPIRVSAEANSRDSTATHDLIAAVRGDDTLLVRVIGGGEVQTVDAVYGRGTLSPNGDMLATIADGKVFLQYSHKDSARLEAPGADGQVFLQYSHKDSARLEAPGADGQVFLQSRPEDPVQLDVPGVAIQLAWGDEDTVLVSSSHDGRSGVYACTTVTAGAECSELDVGDVEVVRLAR